MSTILHWRQRVGAQRDWMWRGWQTRYTYVMPPNLDRPTKSENFCNPDDLRNPGTPTQAGTPMILLHGFGASIGHWRHNLSALGAEHPVYALDLLGFGASEKAQASYNIELWVEQVHDFWLAMIRRPVILVGNSIGSSVCLAAASAYPEMVQAVVMISLPDASVLEPPRWLKPAFKLVQCSLGPITVGVKHLLTHPLIFDPLFRWVRRPATIRRWVAKAYADPDQISDELVEILCDPAHAPQARQALTAMVRAPQPTKDYRAKTILPQLTLPMLLLWGKQDGMVPPSLAPRFPAYNPSLKLIELEKAGHCPHDECPDLVNSIILSWLAEVTRAETQRLEFAPTLEIK